MTRESLLIELGTEELPPKALDDLAHAFRDAMTQGLAKRGIGFDADTVRALWTPRRLALLVGAVDTEQPDVAQERRGPALAQGLDAEGRASKALVGFAQSCGVDVASLEKLETDKGAWFVHRSVRKGAPLAALLPELINESLKALPIPKPMRWGSREISFVRPAHWLVVLLGDRVVEAEVLGLRSDRMSRGHRFHHPGPVWIPAPGQYVDALRAAYVIADPNERRALVRSLVEDEAGRVGGVARVPEDLLDEVKNLVEWPTAITCAFDAEFLAVPAEALITTMESNQRFFPVLSADGALTEVFIGIANIESRDPGEIRKGYERVIRPRFADAKFFFDEDLKTPLAAHQDALAKVTYQQQLGSVWDKTVRVTELARTIANRVGLDAGLATRAASLAKCDLMTRMVGEFPELQGAMGRHYALAQGESPEVARALDEVYAPRQAGDGIAGSRVGQVVAIADKLDTLCGLFAIGQKPSGNKDPFSLRRNALGLARTLIEGGIELDLLAQIEEAMDSSLQARQRVATESPAKDAKAAAPRARQEIGGRQVHAETVDVHDFILERLRGYYADRGIRGDVFEAVLALRPVSLTDFDARLRAVREFAALPEATALAAANKRIGNLLRQAAEKGYDWSKAGSSAPESGVELELDRAISAAEGHLTPLFADRRYVEAMTRLAALRPAVDAFFDGVMVMVDDEAARANRLALLDRLRRLFLQVADISLLQSS